jgi:hypothetical protein
MEAGGTNHGDEEGNQQSKEVCNGIETRRKEGPGEEGSCKKEGGGEEGRSGKDYSSQS